MEFNDENGTNVSRKNLTNEGSDNMPDEAIQVTWVHKLLVFMAIAYAIGNSIYVGHEFYEINSNVSSRNNYSQHTNDNHETDVANFFDNRTENLVWFVQVSDLHFSKYHDSKRSDDFLKFCQYSNQILKPEAVIITGDLTDATDRNGAGSRQFFEEWEMYNETMTKCRAFKTKKESGSRSPTLWLDIRGNHDTLNVPNFKEDFYRRFGIVKELRSYWKSLDRNNISVGLVALDATQIPGSKRPFNFFGTLKDEEQIDQFRKLMSDAQMNTQYQIVVGHYPISCLKPFQLPELTSIISCGSHTLAYLCGHLHNHVPGGPLYTKHFDEFLELEVGDWKSNRVFRFMAIDQGQLVFKDLTFDSQKNMNVVSMLLNPMDMRYIRPKNFKTIRSSTHIRALIMGNDNIESVEVVIDNQDRFVMEKSKQNNPNLFYAPWNATKYDDQIIHQLEIIIHLIGGSEGQINEPPSLFSLSNHDDLDQTSFLAKIVLKVNLYLVTQTVFGLCAAIIILPLYFLRCQPKYLSSNWRLIKGLAENIAIKNNILVPISISALVISLGPWSCGYFLQDHLGLLFPWGLFIYGQFLQADATYFYGVFFMFSYLGLFIIAIALRRQHRRGENFILYWIKMNTFYIVIMCFQIYQCLLFYLWYGLLATICSTCGIARIIFPHYLWHKSDPCPEMKIVNHILLYFSRHTRTSNIIQIQSLYEVSEVINHTDGLQNPVSPTEVPSTSPGNLPSRNQETKEDKKID